MKIAIVADTHDNLPNLKKAVNWIKNEKIRLILHLGDVSDEEILKKALNGFKGKIYLSRGNCDLGDFKKIEGIKVFEEMGEIKIGGKKIAFSHFPNIAENLASEGKYDFVFYGHTHKPWIKKVGKTVLANPGNLAGV
ncbi:MAG: YfcE family phosphodiesterase, partial [Patescibacteria group bacterium]